MSGRSAAWPTVEGVEAELRFDLLVDPAGITVRNIDGGTWRSTAPRRANRSDWLVARSRSPSSPSPVGVSRAVSTYLIAAMSGCSVLG